VGQNLFILHSVPHPLKGMIIFHLNRGRLYACDLVANRQNLSVPITKKCSLHLMSRNIKKCCDPLKKHLQQSHTKGLGKTDIDMCDMHDPFLKLTPGQKLIPAYNTIRY
jgi:hypothetical protein